MKNEDQFHSIKERIQDLLFHVLVKHNKVLPIFFNVRYPQDYPYPQKKDISNLFDKVTTYYSRLGYDPFYFWKREQNRSEHHHYHCILFLNGNKIQMIIPVFKTIERFWTSTLGIDDALGLVHYCLTDWQGKPTDNGTMLRRDDPEVKEKILRFLAASEYLAKVRTSGFVNDGFRNFGCSRII